MLVSFVCLAASQDDLKTSISDALKDKIGNNNLDITVTRITSSLPSEMQIDSLQSIEFENYDTKKMTFKARCFLDANKMIIVTGVYEVVAQIPVASRKIKRGEVLQDGDISFVRSKIPDIGDNFFTSAEEVVGMQATKYLNTGAMFKISDLTNPPVIKNNDPVNIVYSSGTIQLKTTGISLSSGAIGDMIRVRNGSSGVVLLGQITNKNTVQISD
jgi:flagella basal body P-ring formation protein FlgA